MKSDISRKQPPIAAYAEGPIKTYPEMTVNHERNGVRSEDGPVRVSGEIISAIRRQQGTSGVDYWKPHRATLPPTRHAKRTTFQNLFFPSLDMSGLSSGNTGRIMRGRSDGTNSKPGVPQFNRSYTVSDMTSLPGVGQRPRDQSCPSPVEAKKVVVTDLACLELGDSVDPSKSPKLAYFYQLYQAKFRYTDYFEQGGAVQGDGDMPLKPITGNGQDAERVQQFHPRKPFKLYPSMRTLSLPSMNPHRRGSQDNLRLPSHNTFSVRGHHSTRLDSSALGLYMDVLSKKPPVKHSVPNGIGVNGNGADNRDLSVKGTVFSINNSNSRSHRPVTVSQVPNPQQSRTVRSASIPRAHLRKADPTERARKRSVHFSIANEIYEYAPSDPVKT